MTPKVKSLLFGYEPPPDHQLDFNIPYQLQKLFARLDLQIDESPVETKSLTKSFHWTSADSF